MEYYDNLERRNPQERETALFSALPNHIRFVKNNAPGWANLLSEIDPVAITSRETLATLPIIRKSELTARQTKNPPFAGFFVRLAQFLNRVKKGGIFGGWAAPYMPPVFGRVT